MCSSAVGVLSEYIKSDEKYDKMDLVVGVARGVAYLHCESCLVLRILGTYYVLLHSARHNSFGYTRGMFIQAL
jgi:hypothetical protein